ncbi:MAG TPA: flagellin [Pirellulales bacterium]|jgi:flagellin
MTRINTNVSSLVAQKTLAKSNADLQTALTRLSTGLRINTGKDDPAGLIASEVLRSDIVSVQRGITNSQAADQLISTADSALGQVSSLLNDIRGLVSEAANTGALSDDQIAANQLQIDSSLAAIDRISQTTAFQGRRLLDGSLGFITDSVGNVIAKSAGSFGTTGDANASATLAGAVGSVVFSAVAAGAASNSYSISVSVNASASGATVAFSAASGGGGSIDITVNSGSTAASVVAAFNAVTAAAAAFSVTATVAGTIGALSSVTTANGTDNNHIVLSATSGGAAFNDVGVTIVIDASASGASATLASGTLTITTNTASNTTSALISAINAQGSFSASTSGAGLGTYTSADSATAVTTGGGTLSANLSDLQIDQANFGTASSIGVQVNVDHQATQGELTYSGGALASDLVLQVGGQNGFQVFNFGAGTTVDQISTALNQVSDATGVQATVSGAGLKLQSTEYGSDAFVSAKAISGTFDTKNTGNAASTREAGTDIVARVNGVQATGRGRQVSINTATLQLSFTASSDLKDGDQFNFNITGGGATFQLGPDVVSNQQARLGIQGISSATLGGVSGSLFELRSGGSKDLKTDVNGAAAVVDEVISQVTGLRGRLGAFQKTTLETNINSLNDTLENLTDAESSIADADFAAESANLTRAQILVQSGTAVLQIANQNPQNVLALLKG